MTKKLLFPALAIVAVLSMVSCRNRVKHPALIEPSPEEIEAEKSALADSVLAKIDACFEVFKNESDKGIRFNALDLSEQEKLVKPDYLLEPSFANTLVTRKQKVAAFAIYIVELGVRSAYGMPVKDVKDVIAKLALDVDHPIDFDLLNSDTPPSESLKETYEICKERGDVAYFWLFHNALILEINYLLSCNPELFFSKFTDAEIASTQESIKSVINAFQALSSCDGEMSRIWGIMSQDCQTIGHEVLSGPLTQETAIKFYTDNKAACSVIREHMLQ